jgi:hypothetical protein
LPQEEVFEHESAFAGRDRSMAGTAGDPIINNPQPSFGFYDVIEGVAVRAIEMDGAIFDHDALTPLIGLSHYSTPVPR